MSMPANDLFHPYPVTGDQIREVRHLGSDRLAGIDHVQSLVVDEQLAAVSKAEGAIAPYLAGAAASVDHAVEQARQTAVYGFAAFDLFAMSVDIYNVTSPYPRSIAGLNKAYHDGADEAALRHEHAVLESNLDADAVRICQLLDDGPNDHGVRTMFALGALPSVDLSAFREIATPTPADWRAHVILRARAGEQLPPVHEIPDEFRLAILSDPDVMNAVGTGLVVDGSLGERDGRRLLNDKPDPEEPRLAWLVSYARYAQLSPGVRLVEQHLDYLERLYDLALRVVPTPAGGLKVADVNGDDVELQRYFIDGLRALADESIGGDLARLPDDVHDTDLGEILLY